ncbi:membrane protein insertion efficiency factor YidD [bacterium]|nr:MAG: membrane protein insertion efficiency factor YidD [bacterium]
MKKIIIQLIKFYQRTISPDHSFIGKLFPRHGCIFYPSCSQYTIDAIEKFGVIKGVFRGIKRVLRCHPFNEGGIDHV